MRAFVDKPAAMVGDNGAHVRPGIISQSRVFNASPVVMADRADNVGDGGASDNATIQRRPNERNIGDTAVAPIWDPIAVRL